MAKLLKHFGLGSKKCASSPTPQAKLDSGSPKSDSVQELIVKDTQPIDRERLSPDHGRSPPTVVDYSRTMPTSSESQLRKSDATNNSADLNRDRNWSLRGSSARTTTQPVYSVSMKEKQTSGNESEQRSASNEEPTKKGKVGANNTPALSDDYSDPFDLKKQMLDKLPQLEEDQTTANTLVEDLSAGSSTGLPEDDYSEPYELKKRLKAASANNMNSSAQKASIEYDDPYEESPIRPPLQFDSDSLGSKCSINSANKVKTPENEFEKIPACTPMSTGTDEVIMRSKCCSAKVNGEVCTLQSQSVFDIPPPVPAKVYQLSAEYGGTAVDADPHNYIDLQEELVSKTKVVQPPMARHARVSMPPGMYDQPWDLSMNQRDFENQINAADKNESCFQKRSSEGNTEAFCDSRSLRDDIAKQQTMPEYGIPWKERAKPVRHESLMMRSAYGLDGSFVSGPAGPKVGYHPMRSGSVRSVDYRAGIDYEEPWDQKKMAYCKSGTDVGVRSLQQPIGMQVPRQFPVHMSSSWSAAIPEKIDPRLPLEQQGWYHGSISRVDAENLLRVHREGSYLIRNSESNKLDFSLSVKSARGFMHMKIVTSPDGRYILGQFSQPFYNIPLMVQHYTMHKLPIKGAEHMSLMYPVGNDML